MMMIMMMMMTFICPNNLKFVGRREYVVSLKYLFCHQLRLPPLILLLSGGGVFFLYPNCARGCV